MKVNFDHANKTHLVSLDESEATRLVAFLNTGLMSPSSDPDADIGAQLEDALSELLS